MALSRPPARIRPLALSMGVAVAITFGNVGAYAQAVGSRWSLGADLVHHTQSDALASPLRYRGFGPGVGVAYWRVGHHARTGVLVAYAAPSLESRITREGVSTERTHRLTVTVPHLREVAGWKGHRVLLGGQVAADALYRDHAYPTGSEHYGDFLVALEAAVATEYHLGRDVRLNGRASFPLLGVVWRSPYTGLKYAPAARLALPDQLQSLRSELALSRTLGAGLALFASHELVLLRHPEPWELATATQRLRVGLAAERRR